MKADLLVILGATASGKTTLACHLAKAMGGEIISADSRQIYRKMDIGTGKDLDEYVIDDVAIPYHLIDIKDPGYKYNIAEYQSDFIESFNQIKQRGNKAILCGGSGLYIETALSGNSFLGIPSNEERMQMLKTLPHDELECLYEALPTDLKEKLNALTVQRKIRALEIAEFLTENPNWKPVQSPIKQPFIVGLVDDREERRAKISKRLSYRMNHGLVEEVQGLLADGLSFTDLDYYGLEYKWVGKYLSGEINKRLLFENLSIAIHQFAKRQMTWFRRMEKNGFTIRWFDASLPLETKLKEIFTALNDQPN